MPECRLVTRQTLVETLSLDTAVINVIDQAFTALATRPVAMPPVLRLDIMAEGDESGVPWGEVDVKTAHIPGVDSFALKVSPGFFNNPAIGLPSLNGLMIVLSAKTGLLEAILLDNGYLTDLRTAAAGGVSVRHLARSDAKRLAVVGTGCQARLQAKAAALVRELEEIIVWGRDRKAAAACAADIEASTGIATGVGGTLASTVAEADIVVTTTPAREPLLTAAMLRPGTHVTAMGSDAEEKNEIGPDLMVSASRLICDRREQCARLGELHHAMQSGLEIDETRIVELGDVIVGKAAGRTHDADITICDLTGTGIQDTAIARFALDRTRVVGLGMVMEL